MSQPHFFLPPHSNSVRGGAIAPAAALPLLFSRIHIARARAAARSLSSTSSRVYTFPFSEFNDSLRPRAGGGAGAGRRRRRSVKRGAAAPPPPRGRRRRFSPRADFPRRESAGRRGNRAGRAAADLERGVLDFGRLRGGGRGRGRLEGRVSWLGGGGDKVVCRKCDKVVWEGVGGEMAVMECAR